MAIVTVREDDPRRSDYEAARYPVVARSWGARLLLTEPSQWDTLYYAAESARTAGFTLTAITSTHCDAVVGLLRDTHGDFPDSPATPRPPTSAPEVAALIEKETLMGAWDGDHLVAITGMYLTEDGRGETDFTAVRAPYRRKGLARAIKAAIILQFAAAGVRFFGTGGNAANSGSLALNESLGYAVTERWLTYRIPESGA